MQYFLTYNFCLKFFLIEAIVMELKSPWETGESKKMLPLLNSLNGTSKTEIDRQIPFYRDIKYQIISKHSTKSLRMT